MSDALKLRVDLFKYLHADVAASFTTFTIDGTTDECGVVFQAESAMTITQVGIRVGTITGTPGTLTISLNSVDGTTGNPSATILGGGSPASVAIASPSATFTANQIYWATLDNAYTCTRGEVMAVKVDPTAGTWDGSNSVVVTVAIAGFGARVGFPYAVQAPAGTYARVAGYPVFGIRGASDTHGCPVEALNTTTLDSGTSPDELGFAFTLPSGWGNTFKIKGVMWLLTKQATGASTGQTFDLVLYNSDGTTALQTLTWDWENLGTTSAGSGYRTCEFYFTETTLSALNFGTKYYIMMKPAGASGDVTIADFGLRQATDMQAFPLGENCFLASKVDNGSPTETTTKRPFVGLILDDITEPTGGAGGLLTHSGMAGGLVG